MLSVHNAIGGTVDNARQNDLSIENLSSVNMLQYKNLSVVLERWTKFAPKGGKKLSSVALSIVRLLGANVDKRQATHGLGKWTGYWTGSAPRVRPVNA